MSPVGPEVLAAPGLERVHVRWCDLHGRLRTKTLPAGDPELEAGVAFCLAALHEDAAGAFVPGALVAADPFRDMVATPDPTTARPTAWSDADAWVLADLREPASPRDALRRVVAEAGADVTVGLESEFHVGAPDPDGAWRAVPGAHRIAYLGDAGGVLDHVLGDVRLASERAGLRPASSHHEIGAGQMELNLAPGEALDACDRLVLLRDLTCRAAARHGLDARFDGLVAPGEEPSALHVHVTTPDGDLWGAAARLAAHAPALTALGAPTANARERLATGGLVPTRASVGDDDRTAFVRLHPDRIELRVGDGLANPYLLVAGILAALASTEAIDPGAPPASLDPGPGAAGLLADPVVCAALGEPLVRAFVAVTAGDGHAAPAAERRHPSGHAPPR